MNYTMIMNNTMNIITINLINNNTNSTNKIHYFCNGYVTATVSNSNTVFFPIKTICLNRENDIEKYGKFFQILIKTNVTNVIIIIITITYLSPCHLCFQGP